MDIYADTFIRINGIITENAEEISSFWRGNPPGPLEPPSWHTIDISLGRLGILYKKPFVVGIAFLGGGAMDGVSRQGGGPEWQGFLDQWGLSSIGDGSRRFKIPGGVTEGSGTRDSEWAVMAGKLEDLFASRIFAQESMAMKPVGSRVEFALLGTVFQLKVWKILLEIPAGSTVSYQWIAQRLGQPLAAQAVGQAVGANPLACVVPCHRVLPKSGGLGGFRWGTCFKEKMLLMERARARVIEGTNAESHGPRNR